MDSQSVLKDVFGYDHFRPGQRKIINHVLNGDRTLGIMPTGGGKSVCYQLPAIMFSGLTLVVSPLISLMKDQVDSLNEMNIPATFINSTLDYRDQEERMRYIESGAVKLLYAAPERIENPEFYSWLCQLPIDLVAIDEAHVLSSWGHDFRPSYLNIIDPLNQLPSQPAWLALTATATSRVQDDLVKILDIPDDNIVKTGFARDNIALKIERGVSKLPYVLNYVKSHKNESGIIYAGRRKDVDAIYEYLNEHGIKAGRYHAGLDDEERHQQQEDFLFDEVNVIVATNAFGMGINKTNVRYVIHFTIPGTIESYYQEVGRAGRDGLPAEAILLYTPADLRLHRFFIEQSEADDDYKRSLSEKLREMNQYAMTEVCLMRYILRYFGEITEENCGHCSNCLDNRETTDVTDDSQKVLSCVVRMEQKYGKKTVGRVLAGKADVASDWRNFGKLSTFGILHDWTLKSINEFIEYLTANGYLITTSGQYPLLRLTKKGAQVLKGQATVARKTVTIRVDQVKEIANDGTYDEKLFERLRRLRLDIAHAQDLPPFVIFSDKSLRDMSQKMPENANEFLAVNGVGNAKLERYGERFIELIKTYKNEQDEVKN
ncbi:ATP-dependent DNA helicase RecQ [Companilactobacillus nodensis DSM 19682 = JCM 14932 = NBRC 107160]|uniref:DNA helicase RecQ n=1 Tax=Companilactobacillus nodensis DSM 19682 = JCM 14932 = NBRC 107160 TaxID=1423775 RepID=A0A0R1KKB7_9LACO|nr:DNA helicase RecQ [Companilactobacillus nodensis]KRK80530.1 ATP-dependent DNA helicase RecQ [Companilactobacillus nodensis DSM 19682 = JCM 14932 = NBRC 107160]